MTMEESFPHFVRGLVIRALDMTVLQWIQNRLPKKWAGPARCVKLNVDSYFRRPFFNCRLPAFVEQVVVVIIIKPVVQARSKYEWSKTRMGIVNYHCHVTRRTFNCQVERQLGLSSDLSSHAPFVTYCHTLFAYQTIPLCRPSTRRCMHKKKENGMRRGSGVDVQSTPTISFSLNINTYLLISFIQLWRSKVL